MLAPSRTDRWSRRSITATAIAAAGLLLLSSALLKTLWPAKPTSETVTIDAYPAPAPEPQPSVAVQHLPPSDRDVELAGDQVAAATIYLKRKQNQAALHALAAAELATERAIAKEETGEAVDDQLRAANRELEQVKLVIQRGKLDDAAKELREVSQKLELASY
jgi:hypothetical protein